MDVWRSEEAERTLRRSNEYSELAGFKTVNSVHRIDKIEPKFARSENYEFGRYGSQESPGRNLSVAVWI